MVFKICEKCSRTLGVRCDVQNELLKCVWMGVRLMLSWITENWTSHSEKNSWHQILLPKWISTRLCCFEMELSSLFCSLPCTMVKQIKYYNETPILFHLNRLRSRQWCIYASVIWTIIGSDNGLSHVRHQIIILNQCYFDIKIAPYN